MPYAHVKNQCLKNKNAIAVPIPNKKDTILNFMLFKNSPHV